MTLQELGGLGEFIGAVAVVVSLVYLAGQIRQNTRSMDETRRLATAQAYQARTAMTQEAFERRADSSFAADIAIKLQEGGIQALSAEERERLRNQYRAEFVRFDNTHFQWEQGFIEDSFYRSFTRPSLGECALRWKELGLPMTNVRPSVRAEIEATLIEQSEDPTRTL